MMKKLYIIDDDPDFLEIVTYVLKKNYQIQVATSLNIAELSSFNPDLILMDNSVGTDVSALMIEKIQRTFPLFDTPVILVSAHHDISRLADKKGVNGFIQKPASIGYIRTYVQEFFQQCGQAG